MTDKIPVGATCGQPIYVPFIQQNGSGKNQFVIQDNKYERNPSCDTYVPELRDSLKAFTVSPKQIIKGMTLIPVVLETGKQILVGIFDIRDIWNDRSHPSNHELKAMVLPDNVANVFLNNNVAEA